LISENAEWRSVTPILATAKIQTSPYSEYFLANLGQDRVLFFRSGWLLVANRVSIMLPDQLPDSHV
jgi:hypothetical protein